VGIGDNNTIIPPDNACTSTSTTVAYLYQALPNQLNHTRQVVI
jgi:hypothetical protein